MVRGGGKFKTKRGGGRHIGRDTVLDQSGVAESKARKDDNDARGHSGLPAEPELTRARAERRELKKKQAAQKQAANKLPDKDDEDAYLINTNYIKKRPLTISDLGSRELTRKEREAKEKQEAKDRYWKLHLAGKTDEAKSDLARLAKIREEREAAQARRKAESEAEAKAAEAEAKKKAAMNAKRVQSCTV